MPSVPARGAIPGVGLQLSGQRAGLHVSKPSSYMFTDVEALWRRWILCHLEEHAAGHLTVTVREYLVVSSRDGIRSRQSQHRCACLNQPKSLGAVQIQDQRVGNVHILYM